MGIILLFLLGLWILGMYVTNERDNITQPQTDPIRLAYHDIGSLEKILIAK